MKTTTLIKLVVACLFLAIIVPVFVWLASHPRSVVSDFNESDEIVANWTDVASKTDRELAYRISADQAELFKEQLVSKIKVSIFDDKAALVGGNTIAFYLFKDGSFVGKYLVRKRYKPQRNIDRFKSFFTEFGEELELHEIIQMHRQYPDTKNNQILTFVE